jgi:hypothetical protein
MKNLFFAAIIAQLLCIIAFVIHRFGTALGSDLMFVVLVLSLVSGIYLLWQSFRNPSIQGIQKVLGILLGILPLVWLAVLVYFVTNFKMH